MMATEEQKTQVSAATENAKSILKPGDRIRASRCGGLKRTYNFESWEGDWIITKSGISDIAAIHIDRLNGEKIDFKSIVIDYFNPDLANDFPFSALVENFLGGIGQLIFDDGTYQFAENDTYPDVIYSPRLTDQKMELFCKENIHHYEAYFNANIDAIVNFGNLPPIVRFWE